jgi:hypothetical protein
MDRTKNLAALYKAAFKFFSDEIHCIMIILYDKIILCLKYQIMGW